MAFCSDCEFGEPIEGYEKLILDVAKGDQTLFTRADEIETSWKFIDDIVKKWNVVPLSSYKIGSDGPKEKNKFIKNVC